MDSYSGGALERSRISFRLHLNEQFAGDGALYGDIGLDTDMPAVPKSDGQDQRMVDHAFLLQGGIEGSDHDFIDLPGHFQPGIPPGIIKYHMPCFLIEKPDQGFGGHAFFDPAVH